MRNESWSLQRYFDTITEYPRMTKEEEITAALAGRTDLLVKHNLRLVVKIAKGYPTEDIPLLDLIQEGNIGLMTAAKKFDPSKGVRFGTHATWWIRQAVCRAVYLQADIIRKPVHFQQTILRVKWAKKALETLNKECTPEAIAKQIGVAVYWVERALECSQAVISLNQPPKGFKEQEDIINMVQVEDELPDGKEEVVIKALDGLKPLYKEVLVYRFGLSGQAPLSLQAISDKYGVTRERIRQIEAYALEELRLSKASNHLMEYWPAPQYLPDYTEKYLPK